MNFIPPEKLKLQNLRGWSQETQLNDIKSPRMLSSLTDTFWSHLNSLIL